MDRAAPQLGPERTAKAPFTLEPPTQQRYGSMDNVMRRAPAVDAPPPVARARVNTYYDNILCKTCGSGDHEDELLLCDGCDDGYHTFCLRPTVDQVPNGPWFCPICDPPAEAPESLPVNKTEIFNSFGVQEGMQNAQAGKSVASQDVLQHCHPYTFDASVKSPASKDSWSAASKETTGAGATPSNVLDGTTHLVENNVAQADRDVAGLDGTEKSPCVVMDPEKSGVRLQSTNANSTPVHVHATKTASVEKTSSEEIGKKNKTKRAAANVNIAQKMKRIKLDEDSRLAYQNYIASKITMKKQSTRHQCEPPPFIQIDGFYVSYEDFYHSLKPRGNISNIVMTMLTYQFNHNCRSDLEHDNDIVRKFAFSAMITEKLIVDPNLFKQDSLTKTLKRIDKTWTLSQAHLLFFPILHGHHWVLVCINMLIDTIVFFNPINGSRNTPCFQGAKNLVENFGIAALESAVLKRNISKFSWMFPMDYPHQNTLHDCGLYVLLYMDFWDGNKIDINFEPAQMVEYRKIVSGFLLLSPMNEISTTDFIKRNT